MTNTFQKSAFVYVALPGDVRLSRAGSLSVSGAKDGSVVGSFSYDPAYLADARAVAVDPSRALASGKFVYPDGLPPTFEPAVPGAWGRALVDAAFGSVRNVFDYIVWSPDDRLGALSFGTTRSPPKPQTWFSGPDEVASMQETADMVARGSHPPVEASDGERIAHLSRMLVHRTALGGARPKATLADGGRLWVAKLGSTYDVADAQRLESARFQLARDCGVDACDTRLVLGGTRDALLVSRFDRAPSDGGGWHRFRALMGDGLPGGPPPSFAALAEAALALGVPARDALELFRRAVFSALAGGGDRPRDHALVAGPDGWRLAPAHGLGSPRPGDAPRLAFGREGRLATRRNLLSDCGRFGLREPDADAVVDAIDRTVAERWPDALAASGAFPTRLRAGDGLF